MSKPEPVERILRFAGKKRSEVSNPCITARDAISIADYMIITTERVRVLQEALDVARNGLAWYIDMHPDEADDSDAETMAQIDAAMTATPTAHAKPKGAP